MRARPVGPLSRLERLIIGTLLTLPAITAVAVLQGYWRPL
jgi:hypothetical protein